MVYLQNSKFDTPNGNSKEKLDSYAKSDVINEINQSQKETNQSPGQ